ncbi:tetratricopeptide repeat protein [Thermodesulfobacteriota bacterium]
MSIRTISILSILILSSFLFAGCNGNVATTEGKARAMENMGLSLAREGNLRAGLAHLLEAAELNPNSPNLNYELALVYRDLGEHDLSLQHFHKALSLKPKFPEAHNDLGILYGLLMKWDLAIESFQNAINDILYKTPDVAYNNMGLVFYRKGEYDKAIECYIKALKEFPSSASYYANLGLAYEALNRWQEAIKAYQRSVQYEPDYPPPYFRLGTLYYRQNRNGEASNVLRKFLVMVKEGPETKEAQRLLKKIESPQR